MDRTLEPDLKYCPRCSDEYRWNIQNCADCGLELLSGEQMMALLNSRDQGKGGGFRPPEIEPDEPVVTVRKGGAALIKQLHMCLSQQGVPALVLGDGTGNCAKGCRGPELLLQVRAADVSEALAILDQEHWRTTGLADHDVRLADSVYDSSAPEAVCPACGFCFPTDAGVCPDCGLCFS